MFPKFVMNKHVHYLMVSLVLVFILCQCFIQAEESVLDNDPIAEWNALFEQKTRQAGRQIFEDAIEKTSFLLEEDPERAAGLLFKAAEFLRDMNEVRYAIILFEKAIEADPVNAHFRRVYGDYLIGYRGLEEQAWAQLYESRKLADRYPDMVSDDFDSLINRSIHIFRRDTRDGFLTFERNQSDGALIYEGKNLVITGGLDVLYSKLAKDPLDLSTEFFRTSDFFDSSMIATSVVNRRAEISETLASFLFRTPNANLPVVRLSYFNSSVIDSITNLDATSDPFDLINDYVALELEKTFLMKNDFFIEGDVALLHQNQQTRSNLYDIENEFLYLVAGLNLRKEWGTKNGIIQLNFGGQYRRDLYDFEAYPIHEQGISLRNLSFFDEPVNNDARQRFRGRRSSSQEIGLVRSEMREGSSPTVKTEDWRFFISNSELGLVDGLWDINTTYTYRERNFSAGTGEGSYSIHEFRLEPLWVPVFDLYDNDFVNGWEFVTVGFPLVANTDEGPYDRFTSGITFNGQYVVSQAKLTLGFSAGIEYAHYMEADQEDFGGFVQFSIF